MRARDGLIEATVGLLRRHGVAGTGLTAITEASGRSRRTIYLNFPQGKAQLVEAATRAAGQFMADVIAALPLEDPAAAIRRFGALWETTLIESRFLSGCPIVAAALGRAEAPEAADAAGDAFRQWIETLTVSLVEHSAMEPRRARAVATTMVATVEGAIIMSAATRSVEPLHQALSVLEELVAPDDRSVTPRTSV
ncbi:hypothetical protein AXK57_13135 [Tsukamurella pulmonis]|uniref:TetR/AcrR family transcriptional regulator n=1 Tax=Tsukamurella pulmonis TaxID=47312 RepID=UPI0007983BC7|nr:TetR family transcriptional regulator [Tsukamurella pulmonis]KXP09779.1 hypothetical protein AXK57_13135 [Tsukamurella pulmonis]RDH09715.1 TetR/AcrR family transcriptional regulator [Tsukamurella pulmonis]